MCSRGKGRSNYNMELRLFFFFFFLFFWGGGGGGGGDMVSSNLRQKSFNSFPKSKFRKFGPP